MVLVVKLKVELLTTEKKIQQKKNLYSNKEPENLSEVLMQLKVAPKMNLFLLLSSCESPYKSISFLILSDKDSKLSSTDLTLFIRSRRC